MAAGRPSEYTPEIIDHVREYLDDCQDTEEQQLTGLSAKGTELYKSKLNVKIPTIEGLAVHLRIHRDTIYHWCKEHPEFSDIIEELRAEQANRLLNKGLSGEYNPTIAKVLLTKHGYSDKIETDITSGGLPIQINEAVAAKNGLTREPESNS